MNVKELYDYKIKKYKENEMCDKFDWFYELDLEGLLGLLMLDKRVNYHYCHTRRYFFEKYEDIINESIAKIENDLEISGILNEEVNRIYGKSDVDFEYKKFVFIYVSVFDRLNKSKLIIDLVKKTPEELYIFIFGDDKDSRLLDCLNYKFNYLDFMKLFAVGLHFYGDDILRYDDLKMDLLKYYYDDKYKCLFESFKLVKVEYQDEEVLDIDMMIKLAISKRYLSDEDLNDKRERFIVINDEDCNKILKNYEQKYKDLMSDLIIDYEVDLTKKKNKQFIKKFK